jgi:hypothetical protein
MYHRIWRNRQIRVGTVRRDMETRAMRCIERQRNPPEKRLRMGTQVDDNIVKCATKTRNCLRLGMRRNLIVKASQGM